MLDTLLKNKQSIIYKFLRMVDLQEVPTFVQAQYVTEMKQGSTKCTLCGILSFKLNPFCSHIFHLSLVLILRVFRVRRVYWGSIFFSLVLILRIPAYLGIKGDQFFSDKNVFGACFTYKLVYYNLYYMSNFTQNCPFLTQN